MAINQIALDRLKASTFTITTFVKVMEQMLQSRDMLGCDDLNIPLSIPIDYQADGDEVEPNDMIPYIIIGLRPVTVEKT